MEPKILIIGGAGYIGSILTELLLKDGYSVRVFDNFLFGGVGLDEIKKGKFGEKLEIIKDDICNLKALSKACEGVDSVVLLAAIVGRRLDEVQRSTMRDINLLASYSAVDAAIEHGVERFIFASSDNVYGTASGLVYETQIPEPHTLYSRLKLRMEERILNSKRKYFHPSILRIGSCYGFSKRMRFDLPANQLLRDAAIKKEAYLPSAKESRAFIHVKDAASAIKLSLTSHINLVTGDIFNVCTEAENFNMGQVAEKVAKIVPEANIKIGSEKPGLEQYKLSCSKISKVLDYAPKYSMLDGLGELAEIINDPKNKYIADPYSLQFNNNPGNLTPKSTSL